MTTVTTLTMLKPTFSLGLELVAGDAEGVSEETAQSLFNRVRVAIAEWDDENEEYVQVECTYHRVTEEEAKIG